MHIFDPLSIDYQLVKLKTASMALGGSITVVDQESSNEENEVTKRIDVPLAVVRDFIKRTNQVSKFIEPLTVSMVTYQGLPLVLEPIPDTTMNEIEWNPISKQIAQAVVNKISKSKEDWFFDGRYIYHFDTNDMYKNIVSGDALNEAGNFRTVPVKAINTMKFHEKSVDIASRACIAIVFDREHYAVTAPLWQSTSSIGQGHLSSEEDDESVSGKSQIGSISAQFDTIDDKLCVNLEFALRAGRSIRKLFGPEYLEPLNMAELMVDLRTINLPNLPKSVKSTYAIGMTFTHALAWLLGFISRSSTDIHTIMELRSVTKHLTGRGIARRSSISVEHIYHAGEIVDIPQLCLSE